VIETPPAGRLPVMTYVMGYDEAVMASAIQREVSRGGQVFYVQNRIDRLEATAARLARMAPAAKVTLVHGRLRSVELERRMREFVSAQTQILLTTAIIEAGLDLPNVNTLIVEHADRFGLSELYQLRGRVGRGRRQAYAYFTYDPVSPLTPVARERLQTIATCQGLGGGLRIAMKDLELRGAGNLLGPEQHGHVAAVGLELYCQLLAEAVAELRGQPVEEERPWELRVPVDAYLPDEYAGDDQQKMVMYQQLVQAETMEAVARVREAWRDGYGPLPEPALRLLELAELKVLGRGAGVGSIRMEEDGDVVVRAGRREWVVRGASSWSETFLTLKRFLEGLNHSSAFPPSAGLEFRSSGERGR